MGEEQKKTPTGSLEATTGFEPVMRVLQTLALPLGHVAVTLDNNKQLIVACYWRAGNGTRTRDLFLGKEAFYQLNHARALLRYINFINASEYSILQKFRQPQLKEVLAQSSRVPFSQS